MTRIAAPRERELLPLTIGKDGFSLPLELVTSTQAILARKRSGKSYSNAKSGGFAGPLARLVELGLVEAVKNGVVRGSEMLFLRGKGRGR